MLIKASLSRRQLLESTASAMLLLPLLRVFRETEAYGQTAITPRAIFVYFPAGSYKESFWPKAAGGGLGPLPIVTSPLEAHKADLTFFSGLSTRGESNHYGGPRQVFAGWGGTATAGVNPAPYSLDQLLADRLGGNTLRRLVALGVYSSFDGQKPVSFRDNGQPLPAQDNPGAAYADIFGSFTPSTGGSGALRLAQIDIQQGRKRIIDFIREDLRQVKRKLGPLEGSMFEAHVLALDDLGKEIARQQSISQQTPPISSVSCGPKALESMIPTAGNVDPNSWPKWYHRTEATAAINKVNREMLVQALACGITRVGLLQYGFSDLDREFTFEGNTASGIAYHSLSHANTVGFHNIQKSIMTEVATLITQLKGVKLGDKTLFDETLMLVASDIGENPNNHDGVNIPAFLAGRLSGRLQGGRLIEYGYDPYNSNANTPWNHLLVSIAHLMGQTDVQAIGNASFKGPLKELVG